MKSPIHSGYKTLSGGMLRNRIFLSFTRFGWGHEGQATLLSRRQIRVGHHADVTTNDQGNPIEP